MPRPSTRPVVLLHGLLSTPREFGLIALPLRAAGVPLVTPEIEGYTEADRRTPRRWHEWVDAAAEAIAREVPKGQPFVLGGLCTGGLIAAALAIEGRLPLHSVVLMSPTFAFDGWGRTDLWHWRRLAYALHIDRWIAVSERSPYGIKNERLRQWVARDMERRASSAAGPSKLPLWAVGETERMAAHVRLHLARVTARKVVLHAREDEVCSLERVDQVFRASAGADDAMVVLENSFHMVTLDNDRKRVVEELLKAATFERVPDSRNAALPMAVPAANRGFVSSGVAA